MQRGRRSASALFILAALLFSQWVTASYACSMPLQQAVQMSGDMATGCDELGTPNTCEQHCYGAHAATDSGTSPSLPHVTDLIPLRVELVAAPRLQVALEARRESPPDPPPAIRFSVLRI